MEVYHRDLNAVHAHKHALAPNPRSTALKPGPGDPVQRRVGSSSHESKTCTKAVCRGKRWICSFPASSRLWSAAVRRRGTGRFDLGSR